MSNMSKIKYRKDIDGLRALAVMSVVLYHLDISWVKSGFLGVDIFFVISGYLITSIILRDLNTNSFSLKNIYLRRMRRILPALIAVLVVVTFFAWLILLPEDLKNYSKSLVSALGSFSNLFFFKTLNFGYFSTDASIIPLLHTWSLGIEEQFYVFWPIFLILVFKYGFSRKQQATSNKQQQIICILSALTIVITIMSIFMFRHYGDYKFYYLPSTRAFELLFGCILAIYLSKKQATSNIIITHLLSIIALAFMLTPMLMIHVGYPSYWTVVACLGAVMYIYAGANSTPIVNRLFSFKPIVAIGLISYSLYLWHWPIIAYVNYLSIDKTAVVSILVVLSSIVLATLTYFIIEIQFRHRFAWTLRKTSLVLWITPIVAATSFMVISKSNNDFGFNQQPKNLGLNYFGGNITSTSGCHTGQDYNTHVINKKCFIGDKTNENTSVLVFGDSHAMADQGMLNEWLNSLGLKGYIYTKSLTGSQKYYKFIMYNKDFSDNMSFFITKLHPKIIILAGDWSSQTYVKDKAYLNIKKAIKVMINSNITPVIIRDMPSMENIKPNCGLTTIDRLLGRTCYVTSQNNSSIFIQDIQKEFPSIRIINPASVFCNGGRCYSSIDGTNLYMDDQHLSYAGSKLIGEIYLNKYGNPLSMDPTIKS